MPKQKPVAMSMRLLVVLFCIVFSFSCALAGTSGILEGRVIDKDTKEPLVGVSVIIVGTSQGAATDVDGNFQINNVEAGMYDLRFTNIGYQTLVYRKVDVRTDLRTKISIELVPSAVELGEIEVTAERPLIEKDVTSTNYSLGQSQVDKLPIRNVQDLITLFPSVTAEGNVRGGKITEVVYMVDGLPMQDVVGGGVGSTLPKSSITEFSIQSGGFDAEYGNALSGVINIITRRGTDRHNLVLRVEKDDWLAGGWNQQHNRSSEIEWTLSGPLVRERLHYFTANTIQLNDTRWWQDFNKFFNSPVTSDVSGLGKLDYTVSSRVRLTAQNVYSVKRWRDYEFSWRFNLNGLPPRRRSSYRTTATLSHTISDIVHYSLSFSHYFLESRLGEDKNALDLTPYEYDFYLEYVTRGSRAWWSDTKQKIYTGKTDFVIQPNPHNVIKMGFELNQYDIFSDIVKYEPQRTYFGKILPDEPLLNYSTAYHYYPRAGSAYFQDKLEVEKDGAVVNLGFRWDFLDPRSERPVVEYVKPDSTAGQFQSQVTRFVPASLKQQISPRMGLSFPLMYNMLLVMNYGHYFQFPLFDYLYSGINPQQLRSGVSVLVGNPDLKPERTHAWEIGVKYGLDEKSLLSVTYFKKEFIDQIDSKTFLPSKARLAGDYGFAEYVNNAFANAEGLEFVLSRNRDEKLSGSISYSLMRTEGVSEYVNQGINLQQWGFPVLNEPYPLSWDQLHTLKVAVDAQLPLEIVCNMIWTYNTGRPYTYFPTRDGYTAEDTTVAFIPNNARLPADNLVNVKFSKKFVIGGLTSLSVYGDIRNLFNAKNAKWSDANGRIGGQLADPSAYYEPRRVSIGLRYEM
ncbi:MAG: TonB-dependent receptor [Ignavibacteria bacterium]|nr:TonB-dependent receptor [Ignavibacteria bacterium]